MAGDTINMPTVAGATPTGQSTWKDVPGSLQSLYQSATGNLNDQLNQPYIPYSGPRVAGLSGLQQSAADMVTRDTPWIENQYGAAANALGGYKPMEAATASAAQMQAPGALSAATWQAPTIDAQRADISRLGQTYNPNLSQQQMQLSTDKWPNQMQQYMSPYTQQVTQEIARLGNQNLQENIMPGVNSTFTGQGQFGSTRNAEFANRAMRDAQREIMGQQAKSLESGYGTSANIFGTDQARALQAQQGTASNLLGLGGLGLQANTAANQAYLAGIGQNQSAAQAQAALQAQAASQNAAAQNQMGQFNVGNQMQTNLANQGAVNQFGLANAGYQQQANQFNANAPLNLASAYQGLGSSGAGALSQLAGTQSALGGIQQGNQQKSLDTAYQDFMNQKNYNLTNTNNVLGSLNSITPLVSGQSTGYGFSSPGTTRAQNVVSGLGAAASLWDAWKQANPSAPDSANPNPPPDSTVTGQQSTAPANSLSGQYNAAHANDPNSLAYDNSVSAPSSFNPSANDITSWLTSQGLGTGQQDLVQGFNKWNYTNPNQRMTWDQLNNTMNPTNA